MPPESADLWWTIIQPKKYEGWQLVDDGESFTTLSFAKQEHVALASYKEIPAWSLAALFDAMPKIINNETLFIETSAALWHIGYRNIYIARADNLIDACVELIVKLHEEELL